MPQRIALVQEGRYSISQSIVLITNIYKTIIESILLINAYSDYQAQTITIEQARAPWCVFYSRSLPCFAIPFVL